MLNEIMQNEELRKRKLTDLYEKGVIKLGDEIPYIHEGFRYLSSEERNGSRDKEFSTKGLDIKWQAIGVEEILGERCLKLIAKFPVFNLELAGARGCKYGIGEVDNISQLFATGKGALEGRSIRIEDVNQLLGVVVDKEKRKVYQSGGKYWDININMSWKEFFETYSFKKRFYTPESFLENSYSRYNELTCTQYSYLSDSIVGREREKEILFLKVNYWLASYGVKKDDKKAMFGLGVVGDSYASNGGGYMFDSDGTEYMTHWAVRPIIYLMSTATINVLLDETNETNSLKKSHTNINQLNKEKVQKLLRQLEEKRQERQRIYEEEEKIIRKIKELTI